LTLGLGASGLGAVLGAEALGEMHEPFVLLMVLAVAAHLAGLLWHTIRHRENIAWSMVNGRKRGLADQAIPKAHVVAALLVLVLTAGWGSALARGFDSAKGELRLPLVGTTIRLGGADDDERDEAKHEGSAEAEQSRKKPDHDDD